MNRLCVFGVVLMVCGFASAEVLYNISSFNNDGSTGTYHWKTGITDIAVAPGYSGTDEDGLLALQTIRADPTTTVYASGVWRFANQSSDDASFETLTTDPSDGAYFQFGIVSNGSSFDLESLTFKALRATTGTTTRGFNIDVSINGGAYVDFGASNVANNRNNGLQSFSLPAAGVDFKSIYSVDFRISSTGGALQYTDFAINGSESTDDYVLVAYNFGELDSTTLAATTNASTISGSDIAEGVLDKFGFFTTDYTTAPSLQASPPDNNTNDEGEAVTNNSYFTFTVTPATQRMNLLLLRFKAARGGSSTPRGFAVRSSVDNFSSTLLAEEIGSVRPSWTQYTVDLSGAEFDEVGPTEFRVYVYSPLSGLSIEFDDIELWGTTLPYRGTVILIQ